MAAAGISASKIAISTSMLLHASESPDGVTVAEATRCDRRGGPSARPACETAQQAPASSRGPDAHIHHTNGLT